MLDGLVAIENMAAAVKAHLAARVAETDVWRRSGDRSPAEALARKSGTTVKNAKKTIATGRKLRRHRKTAKAAAQGKLSPDQTEAITDAADADPDAEASLLERAEQGSLQELRDECARAKAKVTIWRNGAAGSTPSGTCGAGWIATGAGICT
jgi:hypothetical protein